MLGLGSSVSAPLSSGVFRPTLPLCRRRATGAGTRTRERVCGRNQRFVGHSVIPILCALSEESLCIETRFFDFLSCFHDRDSVTSFYCFKCRGTLGTQCFVRLDVVACEVVHSDHIHL